MITTIYGIHAPDPGKLAEVIEEMKMLGSPILRVVECGDYYMALEGSHRLAAAAHLGLIPVLVVYDQDDLIDVTEHDWYESANWAGTLYPAGDVAGELFSMRAPVYTFEDLR